jgi:hypothetical protein
MLQRRHLRRPLLVALLLLGLRAQSSRAQCAQYSGNVPPETGIGAIFFSPQDTTSDNSLDQAIGYWSSGCSGMWGTNIPTLQRGSGSPSVAVHYLAGASTNGTGSCGESSVYVSNGKLIYGSIWVWSSQTNGLPCNVIDTIAHEIGHILGLGDNTCPGDIMGTTSVGVPRTVEAGDCIAVDGLWTTPQETYYYGGGGTPPTCPGSGGGGPGSGGDYQNANNCTGFPDPCCVSPVIINLDGGGFALSGPGDPVTFDLKASGLPSRYTWIARGSNDGFLVLDRDGNGTIDSGREMFGNYTLMPNGLLASNGFVALAAFDAPELGGNGNGIIDPGDAVFSRLRVWIDSNHDGKSAPSELKTLDDIGIVALEFAFRDSRRRDQYGNLLRYWSRAWIRVASGRVVAVDTCDVFFRQLP